MISKNDIAERVMSTILELIETTNLPPWQASWDMGLANIPINAISKKPYRGINPWILLASSITGGFQDPRWLTYRQAQTHGGWVKKGDKGTVIVFWKMWKKAELPDPQDIDDEESFSLIPIMREYIVYNVDQTIGCNLPELKRKALHNHDPIRDAESIIHAMPNPPKIKFEGEPGYLLEYDSVVTQELGVYPKRTDYYSVMFHELAHSTMHPKRLNRFRVTPSKHSQKYYQEEIVAEMASAMLCAYAGISPFTIEENASYIKHYVDLIKEKPNIVIRAGQQAQKAVDYILDEVPNQKETGNE